MCSGFVHVLEPGAEGFRSTLTLFKIIVLMPEGAVTFAPLSAPALHSRRFWHCLWRLALCAVDLVGRAIVSSLVLRRGRRPVQL